MPMLVFISILLPAPVRRRVFNRLGNVGFAPGCLGGGDLVERSRNVQFASQPFCIRFFFFLQLTSAYLNRKVYCREVVRFFGY